MKIALCYSGQIGAFHKAYSQQKKSFIKDDMDVYIQTSNLISQKNNTTPNFQQILEFMNILLQEKVGERTPIHTELYTRLMKIWLIIYCLQSRIK